MNDLSLTFNAPPKQLIEKVTQFVQTAVTNQDHQAVLDIIRTLKTAQELSGLALARAIYVANDLWSSLKDVGENPFLQYVEEIGISKTTAERYIRVWRLFENKEIPPELEEEFLDLGMKKLIPIANAVDQGYEIPAESWEKFLDAPNVSTINSSIRDLKGTEARKNSAVLYLDKEGDIYTWYQDERHFIGYLDVRNDAEIVQKLINRIVDNSGIVKKS